MATQSAVKLANHNARYNCIVVSFLELGHILTVLEKFLSENLKNMN